MKNKISISFSVCTATYTEQMSLYRAGTDISAKGIDPYQPEQSEQAVMGQNVLVLVNLLHIKGTNSTS